MCFCREKGRAKKHIGNINSLLHLLTLACPRKQATCILLTAICKWHDRPLAAAQADCVNLLAAQVTVWDAEPAWSITWGWLGSGGGGYLINASPPLFSCCQCPIPSTPPRWNAGPAPSLQVAWTRHTVGICCSRLLSMFCVPCEQKQKRQHPCWACPSSLEAPGILLCILVSFISDNYMWSDM